MTAQLIDGNALAGQVRAEVANRTAALRHRGIAPRLDIVLVGDDPASQVYVRHKVADSEATGLAAVLHRLPADTPSAALLELIARLNADRAVHGVLVQLPLPASLDARAVLAAIDPRKDVDGFHVANAGALATGLPGFRPCTPWGCMRMLDAIGYPLRGRHAVVIGRSNIVGKPMALMLLERHATVTICHSATADLAAVTRQADVLVAAVGRRNLVTADMVRHGAVVIDVGMNRVPDGEPGAGRLCGDVDFEAVRAVAGWITPVPGGVGPMTRAMLLVNTIEAAERQTA